MKLYIHDLQDYEFKKLLNDMESSADCENIYNDIKIIEKVKPINNCIGCFGCWIKTPAKCVINDSYEDMGEYFSKSDEIIIISRCVYGGFSPFVKNVLDRSISYIHPYFKMRNNEMHHKRRYKNIINLTVWFYGENITLDEKETANKLVKANAINLGGVVRKINFVDNISKLEGKII